MRQTIIRCVQDAIEHATSIIDDGKMHKNLSLHYSKGKEVYYKEQIDGVLRDLTNDTILGQKWVEAGCPNLGNAYYADQLPDIYLKLIEYIDIEHIKSDLRTFFVGYFNYIRFQSAIADVLPLPSEPPFFRVNKPDKEIERIHTELVNNGFISKTTTLSTFYYRMTGRGRETSLKIEWIKKTKCNKRVVSKSALIDFVYLITGLTKSQYPYVGIMYDVFDISKIDNMVYSRNTKNGGGEYRAELETIINPQ